MKNLKLATWNIKNSYFDVNKNRLKTNSIIELLSIFEPDILALQEVNPTLAKTISDKLEQTHSKYHITSTYKKKISPISNLIVEYDIIISRLNPTLTSATEVLPFIPSGFSFVKNFPSIRKQRLTWQCFKNIIINNTNLDYKDLELSKKQMQEVLKLLKIQNDGGYETILMGTLNSKPTQVNMIELRSQLAEIGMKIIENNSNTYFKHSDNQPVDYIVIPDNYEIDSIKTLKVYKNASPHYPVIAKVRR